MWLISVCLNGSKNEATQRETMNTYTWSGTLGLLYKHAKFAGATLVNVCRVQSVSDLVASLHPLHHPSHRAVCSDSVMALPGP